MELLKRSKKGLQFPQLNKLSNLIVKYRLTKKERKTIVKIVMIVNNKLLLKPKLNDEKIAGIIKNIEKVFAIPPVK